jgi:hypothetical protein
MLWVGIFDVDLYHVVVIRSFKFLGVFQSVGYMKTHCELAKEKRNHGKQGQIIVNGTDVVLNGSSPHMKFGVTHSFHHAIPYDHQQHDMNKIGDKIHPTRPPKPLFHPLSILPLLRFQIAKQNNYQNKSLQNHAQQNPDL